MNAYELADKLENKDRLWSIEEQLMIDVCHMLRQQADRIAELEQNLSAHIVELELHKAMIQDLERQLKNV